MKSTTFRSYSRLAYRGPLHIMRTEIQHAAMWLREQPGSVSREMASFVPCRDAPDLRLILARLIPSTRRGSVLRFYAPDLILILERLGLSPRRHAHCYTWTGAVLSILDTRANYDPDLPGEEAMRRGVAQKLCTVEGPLACRVYADFLEEHGFPVAPGWHIAELRTLANYAETERQAGRSTYRPGGER